MELDHGESDQLTFRREALEQGHHLVIVDLQQGLPLAQQTQDNPLNLIAHPVSAPKGLGPARG